MVLYHEQRQLARELVEHGEYVNRPDSDGETPLMTLAMFEEGEMLEIAIGKGADITSTNKWGATAMLLACKKGRYENANVLVERGADVSVCDNDGKSILMHACENGHEKIAEFLIEQGCDVNVRDKEGFTALNYACCNRFIAIVKLLLGNGANVNLSTNNERTPLIHSVWGKARDIVRLLLKSGADVNARDQDQRTALMIASSSNNTKIVELLIRHGANLNVQNLRGRTAVMIACEARATAVIVLLCKHGANIDLIDQEGDTAITKVWLHEKGVQALLQAGAEADTVRRSKKRTLFWVACLHRNIKIMKLLLKYNVNVNAQDNKGTTPLIIACKNDCPEIVTLLLQHGADVNVQSNNGNTAAILASKRNNKECLEILLTAGANLDLIDRKGCTIFSYLLDGCKEILTFLFENGILLTNGKLKDVHFNANNCVYRSHMAEFAIAVGAFDWGWIKLEGQYRCTSTIEALAISYIAMKAGVCPGVIGCPVTPLSPLLLSLCLNYTSYYTEAFLEHGYYFPEDYRRLINDSYLKTKIGNPPQLCEIINKPLSLLTWSFLTVSKTISLTGPPVSRCSRVDTLPIPHKLKELLKFKS